MLKSNYFKLYLIRHGQTDINLSNQIGQDRASPLNATGIQQAKLLRDYFKKKNIVFDHIYSSTYERAYQTAKILHDGSNIPLETTEEIREYSAGDWKGLDRSITLTPDIVFKMNLLNQFFQPPNGEALNQVQRRVSKWLEDTILYSDYWINFNQQYYIPRIAVVSHGMSIKVLLQSILSFDKSMTWKVSIDNTSVSKLVFGDFGWKIKSINDCSHLNNV